jgi:hypothetical protein
MLYDKLTRAEQGAVESAMICVASHLNSVGNTGEASDQRLEKVRESLAMWAIETRTS